MITKTLKKTISIAVTALIASSFLVIGLANSSATALTVDASAATFRFIYGTNGSTFSGTTGGNGAVYLYTDVTSASSGQQAIDAVVTTTLTNSTIADMDNPGSASGIANYFQVDGAITAAQGTMTFQIDFYKSGTYSGPNTGIPVTLQNVSLTSIDLDGTNGGCQFSEFTGFQSYTLSSPSTSISVLTNANNASIPIGSTRFQATSCSGNNSNLITDAVEVKYDSVTSLKAVFGATTNANTNYFGIGFKTLSSIFNSNNVATTQGNPANRPPTTSNSTRYVETNAPTVLSLADFGNFQDPDSNPFVKVKISALPSSGALQKFVNGTWQAVALNDVILAEDITNGNLRYTGSVDDSLQFYVNDGLINSSTQYTLSLPVASQSQSITFTNPGSKTPTAPTFSSGATASSGLPVTLVSLTPGVCVVPTGTTDIDPVAEGICTIVATQAGNSSYAAAVSVTQTFPISIKTAQTITAPSPADQTWSGNNIVLSRTPTATSGLTVTMVSLTPSVCTVSGQVITVIGPGNCTIENSQAGNGTFSAAPPVQYTFNVSAPSLLAQTITYAQPLDQLLSGNTLTVAPTASSNLAVTLTSSTPSVCTVSGFVITFLTTGTCTTVASQAGNGSYSAATSVTRSFNITSASLTVQTITYNQPLDQLLSGNTLTVAPTASSNLTVTLTSSTPSVCTVSGFVITFVSTGTCTTVASQAGNGTYSAATSVTRNFNITNASLTAQTINLPNPGTQNTSTGTITLSPTATSGLTVVLTSSTPLVCTVVGNVVTLLSAGTCTITGNQSGNGSYSAASPVTISFLVFAPSTPGTNNAGTTPTTRFVRPAPTTPTQTPTPATTKAPKATPSPSASESAAAAPASNTGKRSVGEIASESIGGFKPGTGLRVEVTGSRISGQFVVSPASIADPVALAAAIEESTSRTKSNFAQVNSVAALQEPPATKEIFDTSITNKVIDVFKSSGLPKPRTVADLAPSQNQKWLSVAAQVKGYVPGSTVYLVVTTTPTIVSGVKVGSDGTAVLEGPLPVDLLAAGGHNIRLVGTRLIDGVSTDANGEITLDDNAITEIKKFDEGTKATVLLAGTSDTGSTHTAIREVYLDKVVAWWTVWLAAGIALLMLIIRFVRKPARFRRRVTTGVIAFAAGIPAFLFGWFTASYELWIGTGIAIVTGLICLLWGRIGNKRNRMNA